MTLLAIYAVTLRIVLLGFAPIPTGDAVTVDPFTVICHGAAQTSGDEAPSKPDFTPGHACEHCNLCNAVAPPSAPDVALNANLVPLRVVHVLRPTSARVRASITSDPKLARGPPRFA